MSLMPRSSRSFSLALPALLALASGCGGSGAQTEPHGELVTQTMPPLLAVPDIEQFMSILSAGSPDLAPDGTQYWVSWETGVDQLYRRRPDSPQAEQLTDFTDGLEDYALSPDGAHIVLKMSIGGSEQSDLYLYDVATGTTEPLLVNPEDRVENAVWRRDSGAFFYRSNEDNGTDFHIYIWDLAVGAPRRIASPPGFNGVSDVNEAGDQLLVTRYQSNADSDVYLLQVPAEGEAEPVLLTPHEGEVQYDSPSFGPDGTVWVVSNRDAEVLGLGRLEVGRDGAGTVDYAVLDARWEIEEMQVSDDQHQLAYILNEEGYSRLFLIDLFRDGSPLPSGGEPQAIEGIGDGVVSLAGIRHGHLLYTFSSATRTGDAWMMNLADGQTTQITQSDYRGVDPSLFHEPQLVHYESFDGLQIPAFLYLPPGYEGGIVPTIIDMHGGPESQFRPSFNRHFQYLLLNGFAILAPNVRGSSGYGPDYLALDNYRLRPNAIRDIGAAVDWLVAEGITDEQHLGIKGASYGGYAVMAAITEMPERFAAACEEVGIVNFMSFLENTADYRRALREAEYGPLSDPEFLASISPIHRLDRIVTPLLVIHGENDPRVPVGEARQIIDGLQARGVAVQSLIFPNEGHGVSHLENRLVMYRQMVDFFGQHLRDAVAEE